jgi:hypothetical protein
MARNQTVKSRHRQKTDTLARWSSFNPVLGNGEFGVVQETPPRRYKIGDGTTPWNSLPFSSSSPAPVDDFLPLRQITASEPANIDMLVDDERIQFLARSSPTEPIASRQGVYPDGITLGFSLEVLNLGVDETSGADIVVQQATLSCGKTLFRISTTDGAVFWGEWQDVGHGTGSGIRLITDLFDINGSNEFRLSMLPYAMLHAYTSVTDTTPPRIWDGTVDRSWYDSNPTATDFYISTPEQLAGLAAIVNTGGGTAVRPENFRERTIHLEADIYLNDISNWNDDHSTWSDWIPPAPARTWVAIGGGSPGLGSRFLGNFDGQGHTVYGMYINRTGTATTDVRQGLFGHVEGTTDAQPRPVIRNLGVSHSYVRGSRQCGLLCGHGVRLQVQNCWAYGRVRANIVTTATTRATGVLLGEMWSSVENSYAIGSLRVVAQTAAGNNAAVGGLIGTNWGNAALRGDVTNCFASVRMHWISDAGAVTAPVGAQRGGLLGNNGAVANVTVSNCFFDSVINNNLTTGLDSIGVRLTPEQMRTQSNFTNWNFDYRWIMRSDINDGRPALRMFVQEGAKRWRLVEFEKEDDLIIITSSLTDGEMVKAQYFIIGIPEGQEGDFQRRVLAGQNIWIGDDGRTINAHNVLNPLSVFDMQTVPHLERMASGGGNIPPLQGNGAGGSTRTVDVNSNPKVINILNRGQESSGIDIMPGQLGLKGNTSYEFEISGLLGTTDGNLIRIRVIHPDNTNLLEVVRTTTFDGGLFSIRFTITQQTMHEYLLRNLRINIGGTPGLDMQLRTLHITEIPVHLDFMLAPQDFTIPQSAWTPSTLYPQFAFHANLVIPGLVPGDLLRADFDVLSMLAAEQAQVASAGDTSLGRATFFAQSVPTRDLTGKYTLHQGKY